MIRDVELGRLARVSLNLIFADPRLWKPVARVWIELFFAAVGHPRA